MVDTSILARTAPDKKLDECLARARRGGGPERPEGGVAVEGPLAGDAVHLRHRRSPRRDGDVARPVGRVRPEPEHPLPGVGVEMAPPPPPCVMCVFPQRSAKEADKIHQR